VAVPGLPLTEDTAPPPAAAVPVTGDAAAALAAPQTGAAPVPIPAAAAPPAHASPAGQIAQAAAGVHLAADGQGNVTLHLQPGDLGAVQVRITRAPDGSASVALSVEKPETLAALQQDLGHLHQALDRAGLQVAGRQVSLDLAAPVVGAQPGHFAAGGQGSGQGSGQSGWAQGQQHGGGQRGPPQGQGQKPQGAQNPDPQAPAGQIWQAYGINITA